MGYMKNLYITIYGGGEDAVEAAKKLATAGEWIAVSDRLPEPHQKVIALDDCGDAHIAAQHPFEEDAPFARGTRSHSVGSLWTNEWRAINGPTHLMPLPEPPTQ